MSDQRRTLARPKTACSILQAYNPAGNWKRGAAPGVMAPAGRTSTSPRPSASSPDYAMARAFHLTPAAACTLRSTGATSCLRTGPSSTPRRKGHILPAEELVIEQRGDDFGWPVCYFDNQQQKLVLAPEYGGDGHR